MNPFLYHGPVSGPGLCDREDLLALLLEAGGRGGVRAAAGPSGHGLSSLALETAARLRAEGAAPLLLELADLADGDDLEGRLAAAPAAASGGRPLLVDDADRLVLDGEAAAASARLREAAGASGLLLFGHDAGALERLLDRGEEPHRVGPLPLPAWLPYALERFLETEVWVGNEHVEAAHRLVGGHPRHLLHLSHELWELAAGRGRRVENGMLGEAMARVEGREARVWFTTWSTLTPNQRRFLRAVARSGGEPHPFGREFLAEAGLSTASSAQRAAASLRARGLLHEVDGGLGVADPLLERWLGGG